VGIRTAPAAEGVGEQTHTVQIFSIKILKNFWCIEERVYLDMEAPLGG
jgi:hypothetical protein